MSVCPVQVLWYSYSGTYYKNEAERQDAARKVAINWNFKKDIYPGPGE